MTHEPDTRTLARIATSHMFERPISNSLTLGDQAKVGRARIKRSPASDDPSSGSQQEGMETPEPERLATQVGLVASKWIRVSQPE
mgnify:CR=1 FL=1